MKLFPKKENKPTEKNQSECKNNTLNIYIDNPDKKENSDEEDRLLIGISKKF